MKPPAASTDGKNKSCLMAAMPRARLLITLAVTLVSVALLAVVVVVPVCLTTGACLPLKPAAGMTPGTTANGPFVAFSRGVHDNT